MSDHPRFESAGRPVEAGKKFRLKKKGYIILVVCIVSVILLFYTFNYQGFTFPQFLGGRQPIIVLSVNESVRVVDPVRVTVQNFPVTPESDVKVMSASIARLLNTSEVYVNWNVWELEVPEGSRILSIDFTISVSQTITDPTSLHVKLQVVDGLYDYGEVVDDTRLRSDILAQVDCAGWGSTTESYDLHGYRVKDKLRVGVHANNMQDHPVAFHSSVTVYYTE